MEFPLFAFLILLVVVSVSGSLFDDAFRVDDRRFVKPCRTLNQPCSSKRSMQCCADFNCEIPPLNKVGICKAKAPPCTPPGGFCNIFLPTNDCCSGRCVQDPNLVNFYCG